MTSDATRPPSSGRPQPRKHADNDPLLEAMARARLRQRRGKRVRPLPPTIGLAARKAARSALKGHQGSPISVLKDKWTSIVGEKLSQMCQPEKITGKAGNRTLTLKVLPAAALLIQHQSETLRQRISVAAGGDIVKIKLVQGQLNQTISQARRVIKPLPAADEEKLDTALQAIEDLSLKQALRNLGAAILSEEK